MDRVDMRRALFGEPSRAIKLAKLVTLAAAFMVPVLLNAGPINGQLVVTDGSSDIAVNGTDIDFDFTGAVTAGTFPTPETATNPLAVDGTGDSSLFPITAASTASFAGLVGDTVTVADLNSTSEPVGTAVSVPFIAFNAPGPTGWTITLTELVAGTGGTAGCGSTVAGTTCTPSGSPFNLLNEAGNQVLIGFVFFGTLSDGLGDTSTVSGTFSNTLSGTNIPGILAALEGGNAVVDSATGSLTVSAVPEPNSIVLMALGGLLLLSSVVVSRRQQRR